MKIRNGFVSNSSSSSFIVNTNEPSEFVQKNYLKVDDDIKQRIIEDFKTENKELDSSKDIWLSPFYYEGMVRCDYDAKPEYAEGISYEEYHGSTDYIDNNQYLILDEARNIAIKRTDDDRLDYIMSKYATVDEFHMWIDDARLYYNNQLNQEQTKRFIKLDDKVNALFYYMVDECLDWSEYDMSYNDIDYLLSSKAFLYLIAPKLDDVINTVRKEINKKAIEDKEF